MDIGIIPIQPHGTHVVEYASESKTPRSDSFHSQRRTSDESRDFARQLETELNIAEEALEEIKTQWNSLSLI